jgi:hypothetical protein
MVYDWFIISELCILRDRSHSQMSGGLDTYIFSHLPQVNVYGEEYRRKDDRKKRMLIRDFSNFERVFSTCKTTF